MTWIQENLERFSPFDDDDVYQPTRTKPFIELAIMVGVYATATGDRESPPVRGVADLLQAASARADYIDWALRFPAELVNYAELCAAVDALGYDACELRHRVQAAVDAGAAAHIERLPHRLLELRVALDEAGVEHSLPSVEAICAQTVLAAPLSAYLLSNATIYAVTHVLLFASRFGCAGEQLPASLRAPWVRRLLCDLVLVADAAQNWDLLGELLLCWDCLGLGQDLVVTAGWASFDEACRADGAVIPRPMRTVEETRSFPGPGGHSPASSDFNRVYHTTLVSILARSVRLHRSDRAGSERGEGVHRRMTPLLGAPRAVDGGTDLGVPPEYAVRVASSARVWLRALLERVLVVGGTARVLCQVLVAIWITDAIDSGGATPSTGFPDVARLVARALNEPGHGNDIGDAGGVDPTLMLLVEVLLRSQGLGVDRFGQFLHQAVSVLGEPRPSLEADPSLMEKRVLLSGAGFLPRPPTPSPEGLHAVTADLRLSAAADVIDKLTLHLECLTGWGTRAVDAELVAPGLGGFITGSAVAHLRKHEIVPAARRLRTAEHLATSGLIPRRDDLYRDLVTHHRMHGPFGWYGPEAAELARSTGASPRDAAMRCALDIALPATLECLWTVAEVSPGGWRLFRDLPSPSGLPVPNHDAQLEKEPIDR